MAQVKKLTEVQQNNVEWIGQGYVSGTVSANAAYALMKDAGMTQAQRLSALETMVIKRGMELGAKQ